MSPISFKVETERLAGLYLYLLAAFRRFLTPPFWFHEDIFDGHGEAGKQVADFKSLPLAERSCVAGAAYDLDFFLERVGHPNAFDAVFHVGGRAQSHVATAIIRRCHIDHDARNFRRDHIVKLAKRLALAKNTYRWNIDRVRF